MDGKSWLLVLNLLLLTGSLVGGVVWWLEQWRIKQDEDR